MTNFFGKPQKNKLQQVPERKSDKYKNNSVSQLMDNRTESWGIQQMQLAANSTPSSNSTQFKLMAENYSQKVSSIPKNENNSGLPTQLKTGIEQLSGFSMEDVTVFRNSPKPAQLHARAYALGTDIHLAPGQEEHLPHEAWHVVQQKQGRVKPTVQLREKILINDDKGLESEADTMGSKAIQMAYEPTQTNSNTTQSYSSETFEQSLPLQAKLMPTTTIVQFNLPATMEEWKEIHRGEIEEGGETDVERAIFSKIHYLNELVVPFLESRLDYIEANDNFGNEKVGAINKRIEKAKSLFMKAKLPNIPNKFQLLKEEYAANSLQSLISEANRLPATMENISPLAGGYQADPMIRGNMPELGRTLNHIARGVGKSENEPAPLTPAPAAIANKATKAVPRISKSTFMSNKNIPAALQRLVMDIYLHWKSRKVMDTRTKIQKDEKAKTPDQAGALRTYHMNEHATIPGLPKNYQGDHPLHQHYIDHSQGSSVHGGNPFGFAEYTGIDSDQNKIVLDYVNGNVYITSTHYKHWFDIEGDHVSGLSGDIESSRAKITKTKTEDQLQSPWVKIEMN